MKCDYCAGTEGLHYTWCQADLARKESSLSRSAPGQSAEDLAARFVPAKEFTGNLDPSLAAQDPTPKGADLKIPQAKVESETHQRREFIVIQRDWTKPDNTTTKLVEVLIQPDGRYLVSNVRELGKIPVLLAGEQPPNPLGRVAHSVVVGLEFNPLEGLDKVYPSLGNFTLWALDDPSGLVSRKG